MSKASKPAKPLKEPAKDAPTTEDMASSESWESRLELARKMRASAMSKSAGDRPDKSENDAPETKISKLSGSKPSSAHLVSEEDLPKMEEILGTGNLNDRLELARQRHAKIMAQKAGSASQRLEPEAKRAPHKKTVLFALTGENSTPEKSAADKSVADKSRPDKSTGDELDNPAPVEAPIAPTRGAPPGLPVAPSIATAAVAPQIPVESIHPEPAYRARLRKLAIVLGLVLLPGVLVGAYLAFGDGAVGDGVSIEAAGVETVSVDGSVTETVGGDLDQWSVAEIQPVPIETRTALIGVTLADPSPVVARTEFGLMPVSPKADAAFRLLAGPKSVHDSLAAGSAIILASLLPDTATVDVALATSLQAVDLTAIYGATPEFPVSTAPFEIGILSDPPASFAQQSATGENGVVVRADAGNYSIHLHAPRSVSDNTLADVSRMLAATGYLIDAPKRFNFTISKDNVRYFYAKDAEVARLLAKALGAPARDFTGYRPSPPNGTIEVWLAGNAPRRATPRRAAPPVDPLLSLRNKLIQSLQRGDHL